MTKILIASQQEDTQRIAELRERHPDVELVAVEDRDQLLDQIGDADGMLGHVTAMEFAAAEQIRWIQAGSAGVEWLWDVPTLQGRDDVVVTNMRSAHAATIAEHLYAMLLSFTRALPAFAKLQEESHWGRGWMPGMTAIKGMTMGIVGFGNIGRAIARRAEGFEMNVLAVDAFPGEPGNGVAEVWPLSRLDEMCSQIDVLAISAPITPQTRGLIGPKQIALLKQGAYVMVMSRGNIVDEPALIEALKSGHVAAAGLDVTHEEPLSSDDPLWKAPNCIITPHISALSRLTMDLVWTIFEENLGRFKRGEPLMNVVDKKRGY